MRMGDYVSNDLLKEATTASQRAGRPTDELGHMLVLMAKKIVQTRRFSGYSCRDDLVSAAVLQGLTVYNKFDGTRNNAFSWFTTVLSNACRRYIDADNRQNMLAQVWGAAAS